MPIRVGFLNPRCFNQTTLVLLFGAVGGAPASCCELTLRSLVALAHSLLDPNWVRCFFWGPVLVGSAAKTTRTPTSPILTTSCSGSCGATQGHQNWISELLAK